MSTQLPKKTPQAKPTLAPAVNPSHAVDIKHPLLWLVAITIILYAPTIFMGMTDLDDGIFINDLREFNERFSSLFYSFTRTIFNTQTDLYYRPVSTDVMLLNYHISDHGQNLAMFHLVSILLHAGCVALLYRLFIRLGTPRLHAFVLTLLFAVHPVLTESVAWICARVETIMCLFVLAYFLSAIAYERTGRMLHLGLSALFLLLALFSKETAVAAPPALLLILVLVLRVPWNARKMLIQYAIWAACGLLWFIARSHVVAASPDMSGASIAHNITYRIPLLIQYIGKIFLPVNLSVFPSQEDTVMYYGIIALLLLTALIYFSRQRNTRILFAGAGIFLLFLLPAMVVPASLSVQTFEYRLYIPMIGVLLVCSQSALLHNKFSSRQLLSAGIGICALLAMLNLRYQQSFKDPLSFWSQAAATTPHSSYANMMLSARVGDPERSRELFLRAFALNPRERYVNYIYGTMLQEKDSVLASEKYFLAEKSITGYYKADFNLARVAIEKKEYGKAIDYLNSYLAHDRTNEMANRNLVILYVETDRYDEARAQVRRMQQMNMEIPAPVLKELKM